MRTATLAKMVLLVVAIPLMTCSLVSQSDSRSRPGSLNESYKQKIERFEREVEELRGTLKIPGLSAVIVSDQDVLWARGFGFADVEHSIPATPDTLYHIASLTKTFAATLIMQLVERKELDLDEPMSHYSADFKDDSVKIKHLLSHTSEGTPGERYQYNGNRYNYLTAVIEKKYGRSFRELIAKTFLEPLAMKDSVPGHDVLDEPEKSSPSRGKEELEHYRRNLTALAQPYTLFGASETVHVPYPPRAMGAAAGLLSTVKDMARYDAAINRHAFLSEATQDRAWTPFISNSGKPLPHGLGWFAENYQGQKLVWHYGHWGTGFSATYLKIPSSRLSLILLANSEALSDGFYATGGIETNPFACAFLRLFVFEGQSRHKAADDCERLSHAAVTKWLKDRRQRFHQAIKLSPEALDAFVGQYELNANRIFTITRAGDKLLIDLPRSQSSEMFPESNSKFFLKIANVQISFSRNSQGDVTDLELSGIGPTARAHRKNAGVK
jgi:CubicO group peptidase (beta-lactamase class C family)